MLGSPDLLSAIPQPNMYVYTDFPPIARLLAKPHPEFGTSTASMNTLNVAIMN
jgi:hypothetical protein